MKGYVAFNLGMRFLRVDQYTQDGDEILNVYFVEDLLQATTWGSLDKLKQDVAELHRSGGLDAEYFHHIRFAEVTYSLRILEGETP